MPEHKPSPRLRRLFAWIDSGNKADDWWLLPRSQRERWRVNPKPPAMPKHKGGAVPKKKRSVFKTATGDRVPYKHEWKHPQRKKGKG